MPDKWVKTMGGRQIFVPTPMMVDEYVRTIPKGKLVTVGQKAITPWWRVVKDDGSLNPEFPGGVEAHAEKLRAEGHATIAGKGKKPPQAVNFEKSRV